MFHREDFVTCITRTLKSKGYGPTKSREAVEYYDRQALVHQSRGLSPEDAAVKAIVDTFTDVQYHVNQRAKAARKNLAVMAENAGRVQQGLTARTSIRKAIFGGLLGGKDSEGKALAHAIMSNLEKDDRFLGENWGASHRAYLGLFWQNIREVAGSVDNFSKGAFGRTLGAVHHHDIVRELFYQSMKVGKATGNKQAEAIARAIISTDDLMIDTFNNTGGSLRKLMGYILPQKHSAIAIMKDKAGWTKTIEGHLDWNQMRWPDGNPITAAERPSFLEHIWNTLRTDGGTDIEPSVGHGQGRALGNMLEKHRVLVFKDAESWIAYNKQYGDGGTIFDIVAGHIDNMAHKTALVRHFGQNPELMAKTFMQQGRKAASDLGKVPDATASAKRAKDDFNARIPRFEKMLALAMHANKMNPDSVLGTTVHTGSNLLTPALLGGIPLLSEFSDAVTTMSVRLSNHQPLIDGLGMHLHAMTTGFKEMQEFLLQSGFALDQQISSTYAVQRYTGYSTYGPVWTKSVGDVGMRLSGANRQVAVSRGTTQLQQMGYLWRYRDTPLAQMADRAVFAKYGITADMWDRVRGQMVAWEPETGVKFFRPLDILKMKAADKDTLFHKFFAMIDGESRDMVPAATLEASASLRDVTRPDTLAGALLHSFSMFKNYPVSIYNMYGRRLLAAPDTASRIKFVAALGIGMIAAGALAVQLRELTRGRQPIDMHNPAFWGKAVMASGGLSIWGDFLFGGNAQGSSFTDTAAGPLAGLASDIVDLTVGSAFKWVDLMDSDHPFGGKWQSKITEFVKRYNPLASNWYLRLALEREIFDQFQRMLDPVGARKREQGVVNRQKAAYGNEYFIKPGQHIFQ